MAKTIKDLYNEKVWEIDFSPEPSFAFAEGFEAGANAVLEEMETFINHLNLGNSILEKFHKLDILADIGLFIGELKREK